MNALNAVIVDIDCRLFGNMRKDPGLTEDTRARHSLGAGAGKWMKVKLPEKFLAPVTTFMGATRKWHESLTVSWEHGKRLLNLSARDRYQSELAARRSMLGDLKTQLRSGYAAAIEEAKLMHNGTFDQSDYPDEETFLSKFEIDVRFEPVPQAAHFNGLQEVFGAQLEELNARRIEEAVNNTWRRVLVPVMHIAEVLSKPDPKIFETLIGNVKEIAGNLDLLNITGDAELATIRGQLHTLVDGVTSDSLKNSPAVRVQTAQAALSVVQEYAGKLGTRKFA